MDRMLHFAKHARDFNVSTVDEYEQLAVNFLTQAVGQNLRECQRTLGDRLRYDVVTSEFGVVSSSGIIRTYFKPKPCASIPPGKPRINCHSHVDNVTYFEFECRRERT